MVLKDIFHGYTIPNALSRRYAYVLNILQKEACGL